MGQADARVTRADVEDFLYHEAALLDAWRLDEWLALLTEDATYRVPSNDQPQSDPKRALFTIADDIRRIRARVTRLKDPHAHAESPRSRTRPPLRTPRVAGSWRPRLGATASASCECVMCTTRKPRAA